MNNIKTHAGDSCLDQIHAHQNEAKYLFMSSDKLLRTFPPHNHASMTIAKCEEHIRLSHKDSPPPVDEMHEHSRKMKDKRSNYAAMIDLNPLAATLALTAEIFFFVIEGSFKAAAVLTEILETGIKASVASVPSVSLWMGAKELEAFVALTNGKPIVIIPDADWFANAEVNAFAYFCKARMMSYGATNVVVAAPPVGKDKKALWGINPYPYPKGSDPVPERLKGIDDFLGFGQGVFSDLMTVDVTPPEPEQLAALIRKELFYAEGLTPKAAGVKNCVNVLTAISIFAGGREMTDKGYGPGIVKRSLTSLGSAIGLNHIQAARAVVQLESIGLIEIAGDFSMLRGDPALLDEELVPVITIAKEFRSILSEPVKLGAVFPFLV